MPISTWTSLQRLGSWNRGSLRRESTSTPRPWMRFQKHEPLRCSRGTPPMFVDHYTDATQTEAAWSLGRVGYPAYPAPAKGKKLVA
ncbi:hypothetical protein IAQ61_009615 [Plenodomus lingam]|uniref:uncharacterized protein n=1 Tax=Leptosphaeria maculans TaxID=5022 RepID=UPI003332110C|nr:hypothetical protein IAQ61_009615 [Plenodomus lingam]